jgi:hypothetical protein
MLSGAIWPTSREPVPVLLANVAQVLVVAAELVVERVGIKVTAMAARVAVVIALALTPQSVTCVGVGRADEAYWFPTLGLLTGSPVFAHRTGLFGDESREGIRGRNEIHVRTIVISSSERSSPHDDLNFLFGQDIHTDLPAPNPL